MEIFTPSKIEKAENALTMLSLAIDVADKLVGALQKWGVLKNTSNVEELGVKGLVAQESGLRQENYLNCGEYLKAVDAVNLTVDQRDNYKPQEVREHGMALLLDGLKNELGSQAESFVMETTKHEDFYSANGRLSAYADAVKSGNLSVENISAYFDNKLDELQVIKKTDDALTEAELSRGVSLTDVAQVLDSEISRRTKEG